MKGKTISKNNINEKSIKMKRNEKCNLNSYSSQGITLVALVITILFSYDEKLKFSNSKGFLLQTI